MTSRRQHRPGMGKSTFKPVKPPPAGKPIAPYTPPPAPSAAKFRDIPGQWALDFSSDDPDALVEPGADE